MTRAAYYRAFKFSEAMVIYWRGRGWATPLILFGWLFVFIGVRIATLGPEPDPNADANTDRMFGLGFLLSAVTVSTVARPARIRNARDLLSHGESPPLDHFMFVPMRLWAYVYAAAAAFLFVRSFMHP